MIIREILILSSNDTTKFADWAAYKVTKETIGPTMPRNFKADPLLDPSETLEPDDYLNPARIALNILSTPSHLIRLHQLADVVCSCTTAVVAGEANFSPPIIEHIRPLLHRESGRIGGVGLKLHPGFRYVNLYHWLLGDAYLMRGNTGAPLPIADLPYSTGPDVP